MFRVIHDVLSAKELAEVNAELKRASFRDGRESAKGTAKQIKSNEQLDANKHQALIKQVTSKIYQHNHFRGFSVVAELLPVLINRYSNGGHYGNHIDIARRGSIRADFSLTLFLSDPESYDGGELVVDTELGEQPFKLPAGSMLLYPANRLHRVNPVTRGERLAACSWVQSAIGDAEKRDIYVSLDILMSRLRQEKGPSPDVEQLSCAMNRLMHLWGRGS